MWEEINLVEGQDDFLAGLAQRFDHPLIIFNRALLGGRSLAFAVGNP